MNKSIFKSLIVATSLISSQFAFAGGTTTDTCRYSGYYAALGQATRATCTYRNSSNAIMEVSAYVQIQPGINAFSINGGPWQDQLTQSSSSVPVMTLNPGEVKSFTVDYLLNGALSVVQNDVRMYTGANAGVNTSPVIIGVDTGILPATNPAVSTKLYTKGKRSLIGTVESTTISWNSNGASKIRIYRAANAMTSLTSGGCGTFNSGAGPIDDVVDCNYGKPIAEVDGSQSSITMAGQPTSSGGYYLIVSVGANGLEGPRTAIKQP